MELNLMAQKKDPLFDLEHMFEGDAGSHDPSMALQDKDIYNEDDDEDDNFDRGRDDDEAEVQDNGNGGDADNNQPNDNDDDSDNMDIDNMDVEDLANDISDDLAAAIVDAFTMLKSGNMDVPGTVAGDNSDPSMGSDGDDNSSNDGAPIGGDPNMPPTDDDDDMSNIKSANDSNDMDAGASSSGGNSDQIDAIDKQIADLQAKKMQLSGSKSNEAASDWEEGGSGTPDAGSLYMPFDDGSDEYNNGGGGSGVDQKDTWVDHAEVEGDEFD